MAWNEDKRGDAGLYPEESIPSNPAYEIPAGYETTPDGSFNHAEMSKYHMKEELIRVTETEYGKGMPDVDILYLALSCGHCEHPACAEVCPRHCIDRDEETGAVISDKGRCIACGRCREACPYGAPQFYTGPGTAVSNGAAPMVKCDLCIERIKAGLKPACVAACRVRALDALPMDALMARYPDAEPCTVNLPSDISPNTSERTRPNWLFKPKKPRFDSMR
jgi:anaerobic dimethyl sulfoxide reductase subunit B (iron-sulfur subunit)